MWWGKFLFFSFFYFPRTHSHTLNRDRFFFLFSPLLVPFFSPKSEKRIPFGDEFVVCCFARSLQPNMIYAWGLWMSFSEALSFKSTALDNDFQQQIKSCRAYLSCWRIIFCVWKVSKPWQKYFIFLESTRKTSHSIRFVTELSMVAVLSTLSHSANS